MRPSRYGADVGSNTCQHLHRLRLLLAMALLLPWLGRGQVTDEPAAAGEPRADTVLELDLANAQAGVVGALRAPDRLPAVVPAYTLYGRLRGADAIPSLDLQVAGSAMGRGGALDALRLGAESEGLRHLGYRFEDKRPFSLLLWLWVYDVRKYFYGTLFVTPRGPVHGYGISLGFQKSRWSKEGWIEWRWGEGEGSEGVWIKDVGPARWHQVVVSYDGTQTTLYVDGEIADQRELQLRFEPDGQELVLACAEPSRRQVGVDYKIDELTIYDRGLSEAEVVASYQAGKAREIAVDWTEAELLATRLSIPSRTYGYFLVDEPIPIEVDGGAIADSLRVNGQSYSLPLAEPLSLRFESAGFQLIELALLRDGRVLRQRRYPVGILAQPLPAQRPVIGAAAMAAQRPELRGLGLTLDRVVVDWAAIEPRQGEYDWTYLDTVMQTSRELGTETILCFTGRPRWLALAEGSANLPAELWRYEKLWRILVSRYDWAAGYEVWDAARAVDSLQGTPAEQHRDYQVLLQAASTAIRAARPDVPILAGRLNTGDGRRVASYLREHAAELYDVLSVAADTPAPPQGQAHADWAAELAAASTKPVWNTANGLRQFARPDLLPPAAPPATPRLQPSHRLPVADEWTGAAWQIQDLARQRAAGIARIYLASGPSDYEPAGNGTDGLPGIKGMALAVFSSLTDGATASFSPLPAPAGITAIQALRADGMRCVILFTADAERQLPIDSLDLGASPRVVDMLGRPGQVQDGQIRVSTYPIYLTISPTP